jgi:hypothetical protein
VVAKNSYEGSLFTDRGPWAASSAEALGKIHCYCTKHESNGIIVASAGLIGNCKSKFINEMYAMIYHIKSEHELNTKFTECLIAYGHH